MGGRGVLGSWVMDPGTLLPAGVAACNGAGARQCTDRRDQRTEAAASAQQTRNSVLMMRPTNPGVQFLLQEGRQVLCLLDSDSCWTRLPSGEDLL